MGLFCSATSTNPFREMHVVASNVKTVTLHGGWAACQANGGQVNAHGVDNGLCNF